MKLENQCMRLSQCRLAVRITKRRKASSNSYVTYEFVKPMAQPLLQAVEAIDSYGGAPYKRKGHQEMSPGVASWVEEINEMRRQLQDRENSKGSDKEVTYKEAMMAASAERHRQNGTKPKPKRTDEQKKATAARRAAKKAAALFSELPTGSGRRRL